jgi:hypothetical protein
MALYGTRHSRGRGNPGLFGKISLDTRFRGYDGPWAASFGFISKGIFEGGTKDTNSDGPQIEDGRS